MRRLLKKKVNIFGKEISVLTISLLAVVLVSAALIPYFARITGFVTVSQGLLVDGEDWETALFEYSETLTSLEEKTVSSGNHELQNTADVVGVVTLDTVCENSTGQTGSGVGEACEGIITTPVFNLTTIEGSYLDPPANVSYVSYQDRVTAKVNAMPIGEIDTLSFKYMLTETPVDGNSPYFVLVFDTDDDNEADTWVVSWQDTGKIVDTWYTHGNGLNYHNYGSCTQASPCDWEGLKSALPTTAKLLQVKVMFGYWGGSYPTATALVKNIEVDGIDVVGVNGLIIREYHESDPADNQWGDVIVDFSIETYFPKMMLPDTYTLTTQVVAA